MDLNVLINVTPTPPSTLQQPATALSYPAASAITLTCSVADGPAQSESMYYQWSSDCQGSCFVFGKSTQSVSSLYLESKDSGHHSCMVNDALGCSGKASINISVTGKCTRHV